MNMLMNGVNPVGMVYNQSAENIAYDSNNSVEDVLKGNYLNTDTVRYARGQFDVNPSTVSILTIIQAFITNLDTDSKMTIFDVIVNKSGLHHFHGYIYGNKTYGAGYFENFGSDNPVFWKRNNSADTLYTASKTTM